MPESNGAYSGVADSGPATSAKGASPGPEEVCPYCWRKATVKATGPYIDLPTNAVIRHIYADLHTAHEAKGTLLP